MTMNEYAPLDPYSRSRYAQGIDAKVVVMGNTGELPEIIRKLRTSALRL